MAEEVKLTITFDADITVLKAGSPELAAWEAEQAKKESKDDGRSERS